jgi:hypothetical protein
MELLISEMNNDEIIEYMRNIRGTFAVKYFNRRSLFLLKKIDMNDSEWNSFLSFCNRNQKEWELDDFYLNEWAYYKKNRPNTTK